MAETGAFMACRINRCESSLACQEPSASLVSQAISTNSADAGQRDQQQRREHARDVELEAGLQDLVGQAGARAAGAGDEFGHHRADQRQAAGDAQPAEEVRQRARDAQPHQLSASAWRG